MLFQVLPLDWANFQPLLGLAIPLEVHFHFLMFNQISVASHFFQVPQASRHDHRPPCGSLNAHPGSSLLLRHEHQVHPRHRLLQSLRRALLPTSEELHDKDCGRRYIIRGVNKSRLERLRAITEIVGDLQGSFCGEIKLDTEHMEWLFV